MLTRLASGANTAILLLLARHAQADPGNRRAPRWRNRRLALLTVAQARALAERLSSPAHGVGNCCVNLFLHRAVARPSGGHADPFGTRR